MYSSFTLAKKYLKYWLQASNGKGHGIHSPFVFDFIKYVVNDKNDYTYYSRVEALRASLLADPSVIEVEDFGAGSTAIKTKNRVVKHIANSSLKPKKYGQLLSRMTQHYKAKNVLELGTSFGITTAYLASANDQSSVITIEGDKNIAAIAQKSFDSLLLRNIKLIHGNFDDTLPFFLKSSNVLDFVFVDGNHRKAPTLSYFEQLLNKTNDQSIMVFDDIHWSTEMEDAWVTIKQHDAVTLSIDLFFIGIVFFRKEFKVKQHFTIRF